MTALIRLYPAAWRERYEAEFLGILEARPPSSRDRLDIVRGALDARLHPEIPGGSEARRSTQGAGLAAVSSILAGAVFLAWVGLILRDFRGWDGVEPETSGVMLVLSGVASLLLAATHVLLAHAGLPSMRAFGGVGASVEAVSFVLTAFGGGTTLLFAIVGSVILALAMAGRTVPVWLSVVWIGASVLLVAAMLGFMAGGGTAVGLMPALAPFGLVWLLVGLTVGRSGVPARPIETAGP